MCLKAGHSHILSVDNMNFHFVSNISFLAKHCICPDCSSTISIITLMRSLKTNKIECSVCGTEVYAKLFWLYFILDKIREVIFACIIVALIIAIVFWYRYRLFVQTKDQFLFISVISIISMALLVKEKYITKQCALQFFSAFKYTIFRIKFTVLSGVVTVGLIWILINGIFLIAYAWITRSMPMKEETYEAIISLGRFLSSIEILFWVALLVIVPASLLHFLYLAGFPNNVRKEACYRQLLTLYLACWIVILPVKIISIVSFYTNKSFSAEIDQGAQPLFMSIESFINDYGRPPYDLQELVPDYMDGSSAMIFEKYPYNYSMISIYGQNFGALYVTVYCGDSIIDIPYCKMVRLPGQNYAHSNKIESLPDPDQFWDIGRRLDSSFMLFYGIHAFLNKKQNWSYYISRT